MNIRETEIIFLRKYLSNCLIYVNIYVNYINKNIEHEFVQFVFCITIYRSNVSMLQLLAKTMENCLWHVDIKLYVILLVIFKLFTVETITYSLGMIDTSRSQM